MSEQTMSKKDALSFTDDPKLTRMLYEGRLVMLGDSNEELTNKVKDKIKELDHIDFDYQDVQEEIELTETLISSLKKQLREQLVAYHEKAEHPEEKAQYKEQMQTHQFIIKDQEKQAEELRQLAYAMKDGDIPSESGKTVWE